jgi:hypothetical protein
MAKSNKRSEISSRFMTSSIIAFTLKDLENYYRLMADELDFWLESAKEVGFTKQLYERFTIREPANNE